MNQRLQQFLKVENITQSQFADNIGVARASVSHILAGRNKPGFDFLESMTRHYPVLNISWLITGKGRMYMSQNTDNQPAAAAKQAEEATLFELQELETEQFPAPEPTRRAAQDKTRYVADNKKDISKIVVFYSDNTFEEFKR